MLKAIAAHLAKRKVRADGRRAFADGIGAAGRRWPAARARTAAARAVLAEELCVWLRARIAQTATPYGNSHCRVLFRLSDAEGKTVVWPYRSPAFERIQVAEGLSTWASICGHCSWKITRWPTLSRHMSSVSGISCAMPKRSTVGSNPSDRTAVGRPHRAT